MRKNLLLVSALFASCAVLSGCSLGPILTVKPDLSNVEWEGVWSHEQDGEVAVLYLARDGSLVATNIPEQVLELALDDSEAQAVNWNRTLDLNGCWSSEAARIDGGDPQFDVTFFGPESWSTAAEGRSIRTRSEDTIYLTWGSVEDVQSFEFKRLDDPSELVPSNSPIPGIDTCSD